MRAVVTGASGLVGGNLAIELRGRGYDVRATKRRASKVAHLDGHGIEWVDADLGDVRGLVDAFRGADVVFHCAAQVSIVRATTPELLAANVEGTRHVAEAVVEAGAKRLVHCSSVSAVALSEDGLPCDETKAWNFDRHGYGDGYSTTKHLAEDVVREAVGKGLDAVIVNPTYMFGPYDVRPSSGRLIVDVVRGKVPGWTDGYNNFVDVRDVARGMLLAAEKGKAGERYILGNENVTYRQIIETIAKIAGVRAPRYRVPRPLAAILGFAGDVQERLTGKEPLINGVQVAYAYCKTFQFSSEKARKELGYAPGPIEPAIKDAIEWFRANGTLET